MILRLLGVERSELRGVAPQLAMAFACVAANTTAMIGGDTLFVSAFSVGQLSRFVAVSALVRVVSSIAFAGLAQRFGERRGFDAIVALAAALTLGASAALSGASQPAIVYAVCVAQLVLPSLLPLVAFNAAASAFDARSARRLLPLVAAASTLGSIAAGGLAGPVAHLVGLGSLFMVGAVFAVVAAALLLRAPRPIEPVSSLRSRASQKEKASLFSAFRHTASDIREVPAVRVVVLFGLGSALVTNLVDFGFKSALKTSYDVAGLAAYLGTFNLIANVAILVFQLALTSRIVTRLGVGSALALGPALLLALSPGVMFLSPVVALTGLRLVENVYRYALSSSVLDLFLVPIAAEVRTRAKLIIKGAATPVGALVAGAILSAFGDRGPHVKITVALAAVAAIGLLLVSRSSRRAYTDALASALGRGRRPTDLSPNAIELYRTEIARVLEDAAKRGDARLAARTLDLVDDRFFRATDVRGALDASDRVIRRAAVAAAIRLTRRTGSKELYYLARADDDDEVEGLVLDAAFTRSDTIDRGRVEAAKRRADAALASEAAANVWALGVGLEVAAARARGPEGQSDLDRGVKTLRKAATESDSPRRAAAIGMLGRLGEKRASREIEAGLASTHAHVFWEASRAAVTLDLPGTVPRLVATLGSSLAARHAGRALALAGPRAIRELVAALPTTRGEGAVAATAAASARTMSGTVRAARALARIGGQARDEVLPIFGSLGFSARRAVARAFSADREANGSDGAGADLDPRVEEAVLVFVRYGESIAARHGDEHGLLEREIRHRLRGTVDGVLDLAASRTDRRTLLVARAALDRQGKNRQNALALLETILPSSVGPRVVALAEAGEEDRSATRSPESLPPLDGWLEKCRLFDERTLPSTDPMLGVLERVLVLRDVLLFEDLSAEELYPVAEISVVETFDPQEEIVRQGDAADDLFVVAEGECEIVKDDAVLSTLGVGQSFGELGVLDGEPRSATVRARTLARLVRIPRAEFEALLDESPEIAKGVIKALVKTIRTTQAPRRGAVTSLPPISGSSNEGKNG